MPYTISAQKGGESWERGKEKIKDKGFASASCERQSRMEKGEKKKKEGELILDLRLAGRRRKR